MECHQPGFEGLNAYPIVKYAGEDGCPQEGGPTPNLLGMFHYLYVSIAFSKTITKIANGMHSELEAVMKVHPIGLRKFHDVIPLPLSPNDGLDSYYFLAQTSLSNLLMETLDVVGYQSECLLSLSRQYTLIQ